MISYQGIVDDNGLLKPADDMTDQATAEAYAVLEEMYGMIWFMAHLSVAPHISLEEFASLQYAREMVKDMVETARRNYTEGLKVSKEIHRLSPGRSNE